MNRNFQTKDYKVISSIMLLFSPFKNAREKEMLICEENLTEEQAEERAREYVFYVAATFTEFLDKLH